MKRKLLVLLTLVAAVSMICSCGGSGSGSSEAENTVSLSFNVASTDGVIEKTLSVTNPSITNRAYWYKATPQWTSEYGTVAGAKSAWTSFTPGTALATKFAQGSWLFEVQVTLTPSSATSASESDPVIYASTSTDKSTVRYISESTNSFDITVEKSIISGKTGTVYFEIKSPRAAESGDYLVIQSGAVGSDPATKVAASNDENPVITTTDANGFRVFKLTKDDFATGLYNFKATYYSAANKAIGAQVVTAEVVEDQTTTVKGSLENGVWIASTLNLKGIYTLSAVMKANNTATEPENGFVFANNTDITFVCTPTITGYTGTPTYTYQWTLNGSSVSSGISTETDTSKSTFTYNPSGRAGSYNSITCIVYVQENSKTAVSACATMKFTISQ